MNPALILALVQNAATIAEAGKGLINMVTGGNDKPVNPEAEVFPGVTEQDVHDAVARGRAKAQELTATAEDILARLRAEGKIPGQ